MQVLRAKIRDGSTPLVIGPTRQQPIAPGVALPGVPSVRMARLPASVFNAWHPPLIDLNRCTAAVLEQIGFDAELAAHLERRMPFFTLEELRAELGDQPLADRIGEIFHVEPPISAIADRLADQIEARTLRGAADDREMPDVGERLIISKSTRITTSAFLGKGERLWRFDVGGKEESWAPIVIFGRGAEKTPRLLSAGSLALSEDELERLLLKGGCSFVRSGPLFAIGPECEERRLIAAALIWAESLPADQRRLAEEQFESLARSGARLQCVETGRGAFRTGFGGILEIGPDATFDTMVHECNHAGFQFDRLTMQIEQQSGRGLPERYRGRVLRDRCSVHR